MVHFIKDGVPHRRIVSEKEIKEETKARGGFLPIMYAADGRSAIVDYDKDKGRFYVKAFLAKVNDLKEIRLLKWVLSLQGINIFLEIVFFCVVLYFISSAEERIIKTVATQ